MVKTDLGQVDIYKNQLVFVLSTSWVSFWTVQSFSVLHFGAIEQPCDILVIGQCCVHQPSDSHIKNVLKNK